MRRVIPRHGQPYEHRCPLAAFEPIAHAAEELGGQGFALASVLAYARDVGCNVTFTDVAVALTFAFERSVLDVRHRRNYAATASVHLDAMTENYALSAKA